MMLYSTLCEESPNYSKVLIEKYGVCPFLDQIVGENKIEAKSRFPLSCLVSRDLNQSIQESTRVYTRVY